MKLDSKHIDIANRKIDLAYFTTKTLRTTLGSALSDSLAAILGLRRSRNGSYPLVPCGMPDSISGLRAPTEKDGSHHGAIHDDDTAPSN